MLSFLLLVTITAPAPGDSCRLDAPLEVKGAARGQSTLPVGSTVVVLKAQGKVVRIESGGKKYQALGSALARACKAGVAEAAAAPLPAPLASEPPPAPSAAAAPAPAPMATPAPPVLVSEPIAAKVVEPAPAAKREAGDKISVAVMDVRGGEGLAPELLRAFTAVIPSQLDQLGPFKAISTQDIQQMLALETLRQSLGCDEVACLAEIGGAVGADYMLHSSLTKVDAVYLVQAQLVNIKESRVDKRVSREYSGDARGLLDEMRTTTRLLVRDLLAQRSGTLVVRASEEGATIRIDGAISGVSPMDPLRIAGGLHTIAVEKSGFVVYSVDVDVLENEETVINARLSPSEEYRRAYTDQAWRTRYIAYTGVGLGVASLGAGTALFLAARGAAAALRPELADYNASPDTATKAEYDDLVARRRRIATYDVSALGLWATGLVSGALGAWLWTSGDDPYRFDARAGVTVVPSGGGATATFHVSWP